jgi:phosphomannomutase
MWKTGHSLIKVKMKETGSPLAGEMSGHIFFAHDWYGFDDAQYVAVRLMQAISELGGSLSALKDAMPAMINTPELRFQVDEARKFAVVDEVLARLEADGASVDRTDGARVSTADGWWLLRASNTQDVLVARAEARDEAGLERLMAQIDAQLALSGLERGEPVAH